ncbi:MAG: SpoIID/LytB domain-containing protein [Hydrococcus sp. C42_A2020_068]|uniref:SpoIID/LytB domain-containing protein n=1 Tax=Pleurocapsa sp. PCC 7327 TaxID=118163 RepID=UPI00029FC2C1|nr:SpoIID/LytB domain-containing protein [Pleurocapsa sp. PCC 7327]AFY79420.1 SpoIID/LytB domain protein [Pleurocapsa sp. PCC 7327]MBF2020993.1 SpoIID/LytB domain-containing protein [Hydrococcus sp. C42_A2020_068]
MASKRNLAFFAATLRFFARRPWGLALLVWLVLIAPAQAAVELRVAIKKNLDRVKVGSSTPAVVRDETGRKLGEITALDAFSVRTGGRGVALGNWSGDRLYIEPTEEGYVWIGDNWYRGRTELIRQGQGVTAINRVDLEEYLYSVVGSEAIPSWHQEALKAQAVAARTYALYQRAISANRLYDLETTTQTQVYKGISSEYISTQEAVKATVGQILTYHGKTILAAFHSSSGGHTENVEDVWSSRLPYLRGVIDYDQRSPVFQWTKTFSSEELARRISGIGNVKALIPERTTPRGRIVTMRIVGDRGTKTLTGAQLRQALDLRSTLFTVSAENDTFQINGRGFGHGIGLSQWGTYYLADRGVDYQRILAHYYQNARLTQM